MSRSRSAETSRATGWWPPLRRWSHGLRGGALALLLLLGAHALGWLAFGPVARLDLAWHDLRLRALTQTGTDHRIVLVDIDERALAAHGRWPWPRSQLAELVERIGQQGQARLTALDLVLAEPEASLSLDVLAQLAQNPWAGTPFGAEALLLGRAQLDNDARLARSLAASPTVLGFMLSGNAPMQSVGTLPPPFLPASALGPRAAKLPHYSSHAGNLLLLQEAAGAAGHLNAVVDRDGKLRRMPLLVVAPDGQVQASLALAITQRLLAEPGQALQAPRVLPAATAEAGQALRALLLGDVDKPLHVPLDAQGEVLVPFRAGAHTFARYSAAEVLAGALSADALRHKVVLVGVSAPGLVDQRMTPLDDAMQGSMVHASLLSGLLDGQLRTAPAWAPWVELVMLVLPAAVLLWALPQLGMVLGALLTIGLMLCLLVANAAAWAWGHWAWPLAGPLLLPPLLLTWHLVVAYRAAAGARSRLTRLFGQYVPPELVEEMGHEAERYSMTSRSAELTVLFADVRGFSGIAERLPAGELSSMMNLLFSHLTDAVRSHRGTLDKYIGDSVMAFWGAPVHDPQHAQHAVDAALAMRERLPAINAELTRRGWPTVDVQIGVNTGHMVVGDMGSRHRRAYTVMGDAVNLAARLQQLCSDEQLGVVLGDDTHRQLHNTPCQALGPLQLRGRDSPVLVWVPVAAAPAAQRGLDPQLTDA